MNHNTIFFLHLPLSCDKKVPTFKNYASRKNIDCVSIMHSDLMNIILNDMYGSTIA